MAFGRVLKYSSASSKYGPKIDKSDVENVMTADETGSSDTRVVDTSRGEITVPAEPERIAVLTAGLAGYLFTLDAPIAITDTRVLGVTNLDGGFPPAWAEKAQALSDTLNKTYPNRTKVARIDAQTSR